MAEEMKEEEIRLRDKTLSALYELASYYRKVGNERKEEIVAEMADHFFGWCAPDRRI